MIRIIASIFAVLWLYAPLARAAETLPGDEQTLDLLSDNTSTEPTISDPLEPMNRFFFVINDKLYFWVLKPIKTGYTTVVSPDIRRCIAHFFDNIVSPVSLLNNLLQGRFYDAGIVVERFVINTTMGVLGFADAATEVFDITPKPADFGETLGVYGFEEGIYFFWPLIGPSSIRDTIGFAGDMVAQPTTYVNWDMPERAGYYMGEKINAMSLAPEIYEELKKYSIDPYASVRHAYVEYRRSQIEKRKN